MTMAGFRDLSILVCFFNIILLFFFSSCSLATPLDDQEVLSMREDIAKTAGYGEEKLSSVIVTGTVVCEACTDTEAETNAWNVRGASIAVQCKIRGNKRRVMNWALGTSDEFGDFIIDLPSKLHAIPKLEKQCMVKIVNLPKNSACRRSVFLRTKAIRLSPVGNGIRTYTTGTIRLQQRPNPRHICLKKAKSTFEETSW